MWNDPEARSHFQRYPVIYFTFKDVKARHWRDAFAGIRKVIVDELDRHNYLLGSDDYRRLLFDDPEASAYWNVLRDLSEQLHAYHGERAFIFIDEYDIPIQAAHTHGHFDEAVEFFRNFLSAGLKDNVHLMRGVLTGVLRVAKGLQPASIPVPTLVGFAPDDHDSLVSRPRDLGFDIELFPTRTPTLPPATHTNSYALGSRDVLIIEPAPTDPSEQRELIVWVRGMRSQGRTPVAIVVTHHHADHIGAAEAMSSALGLPLWAHEQTQQRMRGLRFEHALGDGDIIDLAGPIDRRWHVLHTPGHAPGHVCLYEEQSRVLVLGDMIAGEGTILVAPGDGNMRGYLRQLRRLAALEARLGLPAHGEPIEGPSCKLWATHDHRLMREGKVLVALARLQPADADLLVPVVYDDTPVQVWPLARLSLAAHLEKLVDEGRVRIEAGLHRLVDGDGQPQR